MFGVVVVDVAAVVVAVVVATVAATDDALVAVAAGWALFALGLGLS